ncbi:helix-turn-helix domain-containing protein [Streptomyces sp. NPDC050804]|jgi:predicted DNA-binding transcriptional regulator AlpA|uniref:helix-turn-helix transcriptional regulator n=1 Tax=Streptomyces sp. NPDC050804 TaxID=3154745 RepID=UPI0034478E2D
MASKRSGAGSEPPRARATAEEVAAYLRVDVETLYKWRYVKTGPQGVRTGKYLRYDWEDVEAWWAEQKAQEGG